MHRYPCFASIWNRTWRAVDESSVMRIFFTGIAESLHLRSTGADTNSYNQITRFAQSVTIAGARGAFPYA